MVKYYKSDEKKQLFYKETWFDEENKVAIVHYGKVGYTGKVEKIPIESKKANDDFVKKICKACESDGYYQIDEDSYHWVVIQFPMKSEYGNKRDLWLARKVDEYLSEHLGWRGLGNVSGNEIWGKKLNIYCYVVDDEKAVSCIKTCLKEYRLDLNQARIASKKAGEENYTLKFSHKKIEKFEL